MSNTKDNSKQGRTYVSLNDQLIMPGSPFELTTVTKGNTSTRTFRHLPRSLNSIYQKATRSTQQTCMSVGNQRLSYGDVLRNAAVLSQVLVARHGVVAGVRIALVLPSNAMWLTAFIAVTSIGAVAVLLDRAMASKQIDVAIELADCRVLIVDESLYSALMDCGERRAQLVLRERGPTLEIGDGSRIVSSTETPITVRFDLNLIDPQQEALIAFTSGSTGTPKGVISTHQAVLTGLTNMMLSSALASVRHRAQRAPIPTRSLPGSLVLAPFSHINGYSQLLLMMQVAGKVVRIGEGLSTEEVMEIMARERISSIASASAELLRGMLRAKGHHPYMQSITSIGLHGAELQPHLLAEIRERLPLAQAMTGYGMTETNGSVCLATDADLLLHPQTCGPVVPSVNIRIVDGGADVPVGRVGEIWLCGAMLMSGYCRNTEESTTPFVEGWLRTADTGHIDLDGFLYLADRRNDLLKCGDQYIPRAALERALCALGCIDEAAAFDVGTSEQAERLVVAVLPKVDDESWKVQIAACAAREFGVVCAVDVIALEQFPRTSSGKLDRRTLREQLRL